MRKEPLTRGRIVEAALRLIEQEGLEAFSTRKLGAALGCEAMSIYHHFPSKGELLDAIASRLLSEVDLSPAGEAGPPEGRLERMVRSYRAVARRHPHGYPLLALRRLNSPEAFRFMEAILRILRDAGFDARASARLFRLVGHWTTGATLSELAVRSRIPLTTRRVPAGQVDPALYPLTRDATPFLMPGHFEDTFEFGLRAILATIRAERAGA